MLFRVIWCILYMGHLVNLIVFVRVLAKQTSKIEGMRKCKHAQNTATGP